MLKYSYFLSLSAALCFATGTVAAQDWDGGFEVDSGASTGGATSGQAAAPNTNATGSRSASENTGGADTSGGWKLAMQGRLQTLAIFSGAPAFALIPTVTPGARLMDDKLFVGLGLEWGSVSDGGPRGFALSPTATYDFLDREYAALYGLGIVNLGTANSAFRFGANIGAGIRAKVHPAFSIGTEWGWALQVIESGPFAQGVFGTLVFEANIDI